MSNIKNPENINDSYSPKPSGSISDSDKFGYQPTRSSGGEHIKFISTNYISTKKALRRYRARILYAGSIIYIYLF